MAQCGASDEQSVADVAVAADQCLSVNHAESAVAEVHPEAHSDNGAGSSCTAADLAETVAKPLEQAAADSGSAEMSSPQCHDADLPDAVGDIDRQLAQKACKSNLSSTNVKAMIQEVVKNPAVLAMIRNSLEPDADKLLPATYEPKMTRAKARQILARQGNTSVPWPHSPVKNRDLSYLLSDIPAADEDDDVEYTPDQDSLEESDEEESTLDCSQFDDIAMSPTVSEPKIIMSSTPTTSDVLSPPVLVMPSLDVPDPVPARHALPPVVVPPQASALLQNRPPTIAISKENEKCFLNALDELDLEPPIAGRTRSKVPLNEERLECLEAQLLASDVDPDAYGIADALTSSIDEDDDDAEEQRWKAFLGSIFVSAEDRSMAEEEENDPEYNVLAAIEAEEDEEEEEDYRNDGKVKIPRAEIHNLMDELVEACEAEEELADSLPKPVVSEPLLQQIPSPISALGELKRKHVVKDIIGKPEAVQSTPELPASEVVQVPLVTIGQSLQIHAHMRKHIQLLLQMFVLTSGRAGLEEEHISSRNFLRELAFFRDNSNLKESSHFNAYNLTAAMQIVADGVNLNSHNQTQDTCSTEFVDCTHNDASRSIDDTQTLSERTPCSPEGTEDVGKPLTECPPSKRAKKQQEELSPAEKDFFAHCTVCVYPSLMPTCRPSAGLCRIRSRFSPSEDSLICLGLDQFSGVTRKYDWIHKLLLPLHQPHVIKSRVRRVKCGIVDTSNSPLAAYLRDKELPRQPLVIELFDPTIAVKMPKDMDCSQIPSWLVEWKKAQQNVISSHQQVKVAPTQGQHRASQTSSALPANRSVTPPAVDAPAALTSCLPQQEVVGVSYMPSSPNCSALPHSVTEAEAAVSAVCRAAAASCPTSSCDTDAVGSASDDGRGPDTAVVQSPRAIVLDVLPSGSGSNGADGSLGDGDGGSIPISAVVDTDSLSTAEAAPALSASKAPLSVEGIVSPVPVTIIAIRVSEPDRLTAAADDRRPTEDAGCASAVQPSLEVQTALPNDAASAEDVASTAAAHRLDYACSVVTTSAESDSCCVAVAGDRAVRSTPSNFDGDAVPNELSVVDVPPTTSSELLCSTAAAESVTGSAENPHSQDADWQLGAGLPSPNSSTNVADSGAGVDVVSGCDVLVGVATSDSVLTTDDSRVNSNSGAGAAELEVARSPLPLQNGAAVSEPLSHSSLIALPHMSSPAPSAKGGDVASSSLSGVILLATTPTRWPATHPVGAASPKRGTRRLLAAATPPSSSSAAAASESGSSAAGASLQSTHFTPLAVKKTLRSPRRRLLRSQARQLMPKSFSLGTGNSTGGGGAPSCSPSKIVARSLTQRAVKTSMAGSTGAGSRSRLVPVNPGRDEVLGGLFGCADQKSALARDRRKGGRGRARGSRKVPASPEGQVVSVLRAEVAPVPAQPDDEDDDLAALLEASTTIRELASGTGAAPSRVKKRKLDRNLACLAPDIVATDPLRNEKETKMAKSFLAHCRAVLGGPENPAYAALLSTLSAAEGEINVQQLYLAVRDILTGSSSGCDPTFAAANDAGARGGSAGGGTLNRELPATADLRARQQLMTEFAAFLPPSCAVECGTQAYSDSLGYDRGRQFLRKLEVYFGRSSAMYQKLMRLFTGWDESRQPQIELKESVTALLKGHVYLLEEFRSFFPDEPAPKRFSADVEYLDLTAYEGDGDEDNNNSSKLLDAEAAIRDGFEYMEMPNDEDTQATEHCRCRCHTKEPSLLYQQRLAHCRLCCVRIIGCTLYIHTPKGLRPASITYFNSEEDVAKPVSVEKAVDEVLSPQRDLVELPNAGESEDEIEEGAPAEYDEDEEADSEVEQEEDDDDEEDADDNVPDYHDDDDGASEDAGSPAVGSPATPGPSSAASPAAADRTGSTCHTRQAVHGGTQDSWTRDEDKLILETFQAEEDDDGNYDTSDTIFRRLALQMHNRTLHQVRARFNYLLQVIAEEDES